MTRLGKIILLGQLENAFGLNIFLKEWLFGRLKQQFSHLMKFFYLKISCAIVLQILPNLIILGQLYLMLGELIWPWAIFSKHGWSHWKSTTSLRKWHLFQNKNEPKPSLIVTEFLCWLILKMFLTPTLRSAASATVRAVKKRSLIPTKAALTLVRCSQLWQMIRTFKNYPSQLFKLLVGADIFSPSRDKADGILPVSLT